MVWESTPQCYENMEENSQNTEMKCVDTSTSSTLWLDIMQHVNTSNVLFIYVVIQLF